ncbi:MAG: hypothetical protein R3230_00035 [Nitrosopumilaceae archaeon]|nr:hypothetical protein [Nitrosopumilaceae archaeon]
MSLSFDQVANLSVGDELYESGYGQYAKVIVKTKPIVQNEKVTFVGEFDGQETQYMMTKGFEHYGPNLSYQKEYYTLDEIQDFVNNNPQIKFNKWASQVEYKDYEFNVHVDGDDNRLYLQLEWEDECLVSKTKDKTISGGFTQKSRKWFLSKHMTKSEFVQTCLKAVLTAEEHEIRERFRYKDQPIFRPHYDVDILHNICENGDIKDILDLRKGDE